MIQKEVRQDWKLKQIRKILIKGSSGYGPAEEAYEDQIAITSETIAYSYQAVGLERREENKRWRYKSDSEAFKAWYKAVCQGVEEQINSESECFCTDVGGVEFVIVYADKSRKKKWFCVSTDYFGDLFRLIKKMVPSGEEVPCVLKTNEDYGDNYEIDLGKYRHFKGKEYEVLGMAKNSETDQDMVVYKALYGDEKIWTRPATMWDEVIFRNGNIYRRFEKVDDK